jgi:nucleotide-binding universal stress UspA family protein
MLDRILVPTDGSEVARDAAESAIAVAARFDATVRVLHVLELGELPPGLDDADADEFTHFGEDALGAIADLADHAGVAVETDIVESKGPTHEAIVAYADSHDADLVVMATHSRRGLDRLVLGSVTERTLRKSAVPVLTIHEGDRLPADLALDGILVPTDGSDCADVAVAYGIDLASATGATLHLVALADTSKPWNRLPAADEVDALDILGRDVLDDAILRAEATDIGTIEGCVGRGSPETAIVDYARDHDIDLVVMGTHGRSGLDRYLLGSVTEHVVRTAPVPVLSVRAVADQTFLPSGM